MKIEAAAVASTVEQVITNQQIMQAHQMTQIIFNKMET